ncbi:UDP-GlcNAc:betaGal beta-1,3-N-acetylglucosaminyltransferase-like protein 1, variant 2 [Balamuthia mandrillaris]
MKRATGAKEGEEEDGAVSSARPDPSSSAAVSVRNTFANGESSAKRTKLRRFDHHHRSREREVAEQRDHEAEEEKEEEIKKEPLDLPLVSVIVPIYNVEKYLAECLESILTQTYAGPIEASLYDDGSQDSTPDIIQQWLAESLPRGNRQREQEGKAAVTAVVDTNSPDSTTKQRAGKGPGFARNKAVRQSSGCYLCFLDSDDVMLPERIEAQLAAAVERASLAPTIVGSNFCRIPEGSTARYTDWCNRLTQDELMTHRFRELTIIQPTWFMSRATFDVVGGYDENYPANPEDLLFFYAHLRAGGTLYKVPKTLVKYRYVEGSISARFPRLALLKVRCKALEEQVLDKWASFTIWGAGRDGKHFYKSLSPANQMKVICFCDVDKKKIGTTYMNSAAPRELRRQIPIVHFSEAKPPVITWYPLAFLIFSSIPRLSMSFCSHAIFV